MASLPDHNAYARAFTSALVHRCLLQVEAATSDKKSASCTNEASNCTRLRNLPSVICSCPPLWSVRSCEKAVYRVRLSQITAYQEVGKRITFSAASAGRPSFIIVIGRLYSIIASLLKREFSLILGPKHRRRNRKRKRQSVSFKGFLPLYPAAMSFCHGLIKLEILLKFAACAEVACSSG